MQYVNARKTLSVRIFSIEFFFILPLAEQCVTKIETVVVCFDSGNRVCASSWFMDSADRDRAIAHEERKRAIIFDGQSKPNMLEI